MGFNEFFILKINKKFYDCLKNSLKFFGNPFAIIQNFSNFLFKEFLGSGPPIKQYLPLSVTIMFFFTRFFIVPALCFIDFFFSSSNIVPK